ncbi:MAG: penicillin-binding protein [Lachnospiraceae bacterium]|nr:penicillin-binding protein [Lachnospiraceae bacterium]
MLLQLIKEKIKEFFDARYLVPYLMLAVVLCVLIWRIFDLQIVRGSDYQEEFTLISKKELRVPGVRGNIYDRNGVLLAYNELAYSVTITDTIESGNGKNEKLNNIIINMIRLIEKNGDELICDFGIYVDEDNNYCFAVEGAQKDRFLADIYGRKSPNDLLYSERIANPDEIMEFLSSDKKFGIGSYASNGEKNTGFFPMMGFTKEEILKIAIVRYQLSLNSFQKYIATTVATDVNEKTVAYIMENSDTLQGVSIVEEAVRRYDHSVYFSQIIGYTGRISPSEYETYSAQSDNYDTSDYVGKTGIEYSCESYLQGVKGSETVFVDKLGRVMESVDEKLPVAGNDIYLTIDADLQMAVYHLLEQKIAGILVSHLVDAKTLEQKGRDRKIPVYDVYAALYGNNVIDLKHMSMPYAGENEKAVYAAFLEKQAAVLERLREEMSSSNTAYQNLSSELKEYESFIISMLSSDNYGVIKASEIDENDETYLAWKVKETISIRDYLMYCISKQWVDTLKLSLSSEYADAEEIYAAIVDYTIERLKYNTDFSKRLYKYMLLQDMINGRQSCMILWEQDVIQADTSTIDALKVGAISAYSFIYDEIENLKITPSQLGLEPCSGSAVINDPNTGEVLALVSYPGYDNNRLANNADSAYLAKLTQDKSKPLWNNATQQRTAPGSCFKPVTSVAGVMEGVITPSSIIKCDGIFTKLDKPHKCWVSPGAHGNLTLSEAIQHSCNCYYYEVGYRLANDGSGYNDHVGIEKIQKYAQMFGLGEKTGIEVTESESQISDRLPVDSAIGQGTHNYTTVALSRYISAVANSGTVYDLSLIHEIRSANDECIYYFMPKIHNTISLDASLWDAIHTGLRKVVEGKHYFKVEGLDAAGKTGTAQEANNKPNHALFIGYAPYNDPKVAIAIRIANGYSSDNAAMTACECLKYYFGINDAEELITGTASDAASTTGGD